MLRAAEYERRYAGAKHGPLDASKGRLRLVRGLLLSVDVKASIWASVGRGVEAKKNWSLQWLHGGHNRALQVGLSWRGAMHVKIENNVEGTCTTRSACMKRGLVPGKKNGARSCFCWAKRSVDGLLSSGWT